MEDTGEFGSDSPGEGTRWFYVEPSWFSYFKVSVHSRQSKGGCSLVSKRKMTGAVLGGVEKRIHSKMKRFANGYMWSWECWGARGIIQSLLLLEIQKTSRATGLRIGSKRWKVLTPLHEQRPLCGTMAFSHQDNTERKCCVALRDAEMVPWVLFLNSLECSLLYMLFP